MRRTPMLASVAATCVMVSVAQAQEANQPAATSTVPGSTDTSATQAQSNTSVPTSGQSATPPAWNQPAPSSAAMPPMSAAPAEPPTTMASPVQLPAPPTGTDKVNPEAPLETGPVPMKGKWNPVLYGFVEFDAIHDSTQSLGDFAGNTIIQGGGASSLAKYQGSHSRAQFGVRNSRIGFKLSAPEMNGIKTSGILEMDFLGNQPGTPPTPAVTENGYFTSPTFRVRHMALKMETPYVNVLAGQYWQLFGWQSYFHPATVEIQGVPGQIFSRAPQFRVSHTFKTDPVNVELAVAASRPPQRDSGVPDGEGGLRLIFNDWKGVRTMGGAGTAGDPAAIGVSGVMRRFRVLDYEAQPKFSLPVSGWGISLDGMLPIIPATLTDRSNALTINGSYVLGRGISDLFTGLIDGNMTTAWPVPNPGNVANPSYTGNIDSGLVEFGNGGTLHAIRWRAFLTGIQYYLPPSGNVWVALNYSHMNSSNIMNYLPLTNPNVTAGVYKKSEWYDANLFWDPTVATRFGVEYAHFRQIMGDNTHRANDRAQFSGWLIF